MLIESREAPGGSGGTRGGALEKASRGGGEAGVSDWRGGMTETTVEDNMRRPRIYVSTAPAADFGDRASTESEDRENSTAAGVLSVLDVDESDVSVVVDERELEDSVALSQGRTTTRRWLRLIREPAESSREAGLRGRVSERWSPPAETVSGSVAVPAAVTGFLKPVSSTMRLALRVDSACGGMSAIERIVGPGRGGRGQGDVTVC